MKNTLWFKGHRLWAQGLLLLSLRWAERWAGFDPSTGLYRANAPGTVLIVLIVFLVIAEAVLCARLPGGKRAYLSCLAPLEDGQARILSAGSVMLCAGALATPFTDGADALRIAAAGLGLAAAAGLVLLARLPRRGGAPRPYHLIPAMLFSVLFVLEVYLPEEANPVLARYYPAVLAASLTACAFYQMAGFAMGEGSPRWFVFFGDLAVVSCLAAMGDRPWSMGRTMVYLGCALILTAFLLTRRAEILPEPEEDEGAEPPEEA